MARVWTLPFEGGAGTNRPASGYAAQDQVPTTLMPCDAFDPSSDESVILEGIVPAEYAGGTLKLRLVGCANTTTAADDARFDVATEFRTAGAAEALNADNFDGTPDSGTMTFSTTAYSMQELVITLTPATTPVAGDRFRVKVTRDADNGAGLDDLAVDCLVTNYELYEEA